MKPKSSLSAKIILMVEIILLISSVLFCTVSVYRARVGIRKAIQQRMLDIANCASGSVDGDALKALTKQNVGGGAYNDIYDTLAVFRDNTELAYVYAIRDEGGGRFTFTVDTDRYSPADFGDEVKFTRALASAGRGAAAVDEVPYSDQWGEFYSAYSPVFDSAGAVAGIIAADFSAEWFDAQLSAQTRSTVVSYAVILLLSLLVAAILSLTTVRPYVRMQGQLLEEKISADSANKAKSDFLASMSHEIRTPINAILGMNEMILRESRDDSIYGYSVNIRQAGKTLLSLVNSILDFSKIEDGRMELIPVEYDTASMVNDLVNSIRERAGAKSLELIADIDETLPARMLGDDMRLSQVVMNLLTNAVKYTERGTVTLTLRDAGRKDGGISLFVSVKDTGIGIRKEDMGKLYRSFERLEEKRNRSIEGTGLGLAIVNSLLAMMESELHVESTYGVGSVFFFTVRQGIADETPLGDYAERLRRAAPERRGGAYLYAPEAAVLVVDDNDMNRKVACNLMKRNGIVPDLASSGAEAIERIRRRTYDIVFLDHMMPEMDGLETLARLQEEKLVSEKTTVVALTANAVVGARERYLAAGFGDYLSKPIEVGALEETLAVHLPAEKVFWKNAGEAPSGDARSEPAPKPAEEEVLEFLPDDGGGALEFPAGGSGGDAGAGDGEALLERLRGIGLAVDEGLRYCGGDAGFYFDILGDFTDAADEKDDELQSRFDAKDWPGYQICVHALKSAAKTIGAGALSEAARALEDAARAGDAAFIEAHNAALTEDHRVICERIAAACGR